jgi:hypothetical protein
VPQAEGARGGGRGPQPSRSTQAELTAYLDSIKTKVRGAAVLVGKPAFVPVVFTAEATRMTDEDANCRFNQMAADDPACAGRGRGRGNRGGGGGAPQAPSDRLTARAVNTRSTISSSPTRPPSRSTTRAAGTASSRRQQPHLRRNQAAADARHAQRRLRPHRARVADGTPVTLEVTITNKWYPEGKTSYNVDRRDPGHRQGRTRSSCSAGTSTRGTSPPAPTDNAIGCAQMMEAARHPEGHRREAAADDPRRAVEREEEGPARLARLRAQHFGTRRGAEAGVREARRLPERRHRHRPHPRRQRLRPPEQRPMLSVALRPFKDLGVDGASPTTSRAPAAPTARRSTTPACRASASARIRSTTTRTRTTPTSTPTSGSSRRT